MVHLRLPITFALLALLLAACGSSARPAPTRTVPTTTVVTLDRAAVQTGQRFLRAFQTDDKRLELALMTPRVRRHDRQETVADMLGTRTRPQRLDVVRAHTFQARHGFWTRVVVRLQFDHGMVMDRLGVVRTPYGYRISSLHHQATTSS